jgi:transcriptional regulator with XRE-family HTH domain
MAPGPSDPDPVQERARRLGAELRGRRLAAGLTQQALADRIGYDRSYLSQVETGAQVPAEQLIVLCERELAVGGRLLSMFRELLAEREAATGGTRRAMACWDQRRHDHRARRSDHPANEFKQRTCHPGWSPVE